MYSQVQMWCSHVHTHTHTHVPVPGKSPREASHTETNDAGDAAANDATINMDNQSSQRVMDQWGERNIFASTRVHKAENHVHYPMWSRTTSEPGAHRTPRGAYQKGLTGLVMGPKTKASVVSALEQGLTTARRAELENERAELEMMSYNQKRLMISPRGPAQPNDEATVTPKVGSHTHTHTRTHTRTHTHTRAQTHTPTHPHTVHCFPTLTHTHALTHACSDARTHTPSPCRRSPPHKTSSWTRHVVTPRTACPYPTLKRMWMR